MATAQRPSFAGTSAKGYPDLASRFKDADLNDTTSSDVENRFGATSTTTNRLPVDARGDADLIKRIEQWPRGTSTILNVQSRGSFDGNSGRSGTRPVTPEPQRSSFLGALKNRR
ncbi:hypothetical protein NQ317_018605 [Molorchus minor]|uniref:Uncharacterized protein n=1 Tax=Molorchus minor TaxID=1323400 RepID=A0ABQ9JH22_9CUCU|nr:hypothetical protein NQ317_018605 [Molorchus minor]